MAYEIGVNVTITYKDVGLTRTNRALREQESFLRRTIENWKRTFAVFALGYISVVSLLSVLRLIPNTLREAIRVSAEYEQSIISLAALLLSFSRAPEKYGPGPALRMALQYAESLYQMARKLDAQFIGTADELLEVARAMIANGIMLNTQKEEELKLWLGIATGAKLLTFHIQRQGQLYQEVHAFLQGNARMGAELAKWAAAVDPEYKKSIQSLRTIEERKAYLLKLAEAWLSISSEMSNTWDAISSTFRVIYQDILRRGFEPFFNWLKETVDKINKGLRQSGKETENFLNIVRVLNSVARGLVAFFEALIRLSMFIAQHWNIISLILKSIVLVYLARFISSLGIIRNTLAGIRNLIIMIAAGTLNWSRIVEGVYALFRRFLPFLMALAGIKFWETWKGAKTIEDDINRLREAFKSLQKEGKAIQFEKIFPKREEIVGGLYTLDIQNKFLTAFFKRLRELRPDLLQTQEDFLILAKVLQQIPIQEQIKQIYGYSVTSKQLDPVLNRIIAEMERMKFSASDLGNVISKLSETMKLPPTETEAERARSTLEEAVSYAKSKMEELIRSIEERRRVDLENLELRAEQELMTWEEIAKEKIAIETWARDAKLKVYQDTLRELEKLYDAEIQRVGKDVKRREELELRKKDAITDIMKAIETVEGETNKRILEINIETARKIKEVKEREQLEGMRILEREIEIRRTIGKEILTLEEEINTEVFRSKVDLYEKIEDWHRRYEEWLRERYQAGLITRAQYDAELLELDRKYQEMKMNVEEWAERERERLRIERLRKEKEDEIRSLLDILESKRKTAEISEREYWTQRVQLLREYYNLLSEYEREVQEKFGRTAEGILLLRELMRERAKVAEEAAEAEMRAWEKTGTVLEGFFYKLRKFLTDEMPSAFEVGAEAAKTLINALERAFENFLDVTSRNFFNFYELVRSIIIAIYQEFLKLLVIQPLVSWVMGWIGGFLPGGGLFHRWTAWVRMQEGGVATKTPTFAVLEKGERVLTPRQTEAFEKLVGAITSVRGPSQIQIVNVVDPNMLTQYLMTPPGQQTVLNIIAANQRKILKMLTAGV